MHFYWAVKVIWKLKTRCHSRGGHQNPPKLYSGGWSRQLNLPFCDLILLELGGTSGEEPSCQCRRHKRCRFGPWVRSLGQEDPLEEGMAAHSSILAWRIPSTAEPWQTTDGRIARRSNLAYTHIWQAYGSFLCGFRKWYHTCYLTSVGWYQLSSPEYDLLTESEPD